MMNKSQQEFEQSGGWSAGKFLQMSRDLVPLLEDNKVQIKWGRTVIHLTYNSKTVRIYCHYNCRSSDYISIVSDSVELYHRHYSDDASQVMSSIMSAFG